jgi:hypothetical protein
MSELDTIEWQEWINFRPRITIRETFEFGALTLPLDYARSNADLQARLPLNPLSYRPGLTNLVLGNKMPSFPAGRNAVVERDRSLK